MTRSKTLLLVGALALAALAFPQDWKGVTGRLEGKVLDPDGKPIPGAAVRLDLPGKGGPELRADKKGKWAVLSLGSGVWHVDVSADGFVTKRISATVMEEVRTPPIDIKLERAAPSGPPPEVLQAIQKGDDAYKAGDYATARVEYEKLLAMRPDLATTLHMQIARCYSQEKNYTKEIEHLQFVLDADPTNVSVRKLMTLEALQGGFFEKGLGLLKGLDEASIRDPDVLYNIAVAFYNNQKVDEAIVYLTKAVTLSPAYGDGYFLRANAYLGQNKVPEAKADYAKFLEIAPQDARAETVRKVLAQLK